MFIKIQGISDTAGIGHDENLKAWVILFLL